MRLDTRGEVELAATVRRLYDKYFQEPFERDASRIILDELGVDLSASYGGVRLRNPLVVAPGPLTVNLAQVKRIAEAGYGGFVLKSFVGEDASGRFSLAFMRRRMTWIRDFYEEEDLRRERPIIHWDGRGDIRAWERYRGFAEGAVKEAEASGCVSVASFICHLPSLEEPWNLEEWSLTAQRFRGLGCRLMEIDFCPYLKSENVAREKEAVLRWYREGPRLVKDAAKDAVVYPKLLNLGWGDEFQLAMLRAATEASDGAVVANRFYSEKHGSGHGGPELRACNLRIIRSARERGFALPISATGGIYSGVDAYSYLTATAENTQLLSFIMGKVGKRLRATGNKFEQVLFHLLLDPEDGLVNAMLREGLTSVKDLSSRGRKAL